MADDRNNVVVGYPTREIRVTGERCASMVHTTVAVSRFEIQLVKMSMSSATNMRDAVRKSSDRFKRALDAFESELRECQRDLDLASKRKRPDNRRPSGGAAQRPAQGKAGGPETKLQSSVAAQNTPATPPGKPSKAERSQQGKANSEQAQTPKPADAQPNVGTKRPKKQGKQGPDASVKNQQPKASPAEARPKAEPAVPVLD